MIDKDTFYDIGVNVKSANSSPVYKTPLSSKITQGEIKMAEVDTTQLSQEHGSIRHDLAVESARLSQQIGSEACGVNKHIGDGRREVEAGFANTRYNIAERTGDIRREVAQESHNLSNQIGRGFCDTDTKILETGSSVRREAAEHTNEIIKEGIKGDFNTVGAVKDARYETVSRVEGVGDRLDNAINNANFNLSSRVENAQDRNAKDIADLRGTVADRFYSVGRDLSDLKQGHATLSKDIELNALKTQIEGQKNTQYLSDKIALDGEKTRNLINDLKYHDLNRGLVERQTELVNCEQDRRHYRDRYHDGRFDMIQTQYAAQWAQLQNQVQAFQSQLQETRQGMVNFGTMAGVGQSSTSNNVR